MKRFISRHIAGLQKRLFAILMMVFIVGSSLPVTVFAALAVDLKVNGSDSDVVLNPGETFTYEWTSTDATACEQTSPGASGGAALNGSSITIDPSHPFYPTVSSPVTITISCTDGTNSASESIEVSLSGAPAATPTVDVKANGSDGPLTINPGDNYIYEWASTDATACEQTSPGASGGAALSGTSVTIDSTHPFYPSVGSPVTITFTCTDGTTSVSDSVVIQLASGGTGPTVDVKANGSDGPVTINSGDTYTYTWVSSNATACEQTSPGASGGAALSGTSVTIGSGHPFYPSVGSPTTITISCTDGTASATDSVVINLAGVGGTAPTVDVKANGSDGPVTINSGDTYTYAWVSSNATACQQTTPGTPGGAALSGTSATISSGHPFYPSVGSPVTITFTCTDGTTSVSDSVVIQLASGGTGPTVDVKANGSDGPVTINSGDTYTYTWVSANATACQQTTPGTPGGAALSGTSAVISPGHPFYPSDNSPVTITFVCTDGASNATDSVVIQLEDDNNDNGGGGGGGRRRNNRDSEGEVLAGTTECPWIHDYMRMDFQNDPVEVMKLQAFLKVFMGYDYVTINGVFDQATHTAVGAFQMRYKDEILTPWGHTGPTYYVYILTLKKVNELYCQDILPLTLEQQNEIVTFRNLPSAQPVYKDSIPELPATGVGPGEDNATTTVGLTEKDDKGQNLDNLAAALFTFPDNIKDISMCLIEFILILSVLYILGIVLKDVLYSDLPENVLKRFFTKWIAITLGLFIALSTALMLQELCLTLPLLASLVFSTIWLIFYPKNGKDEGSMAARARSWMVWKKEEKTVS